MVSNATLPTTKIAIRYPFVVSFRYFRISNSSLSLVAAGVASGLVRIAYFSADAHGQLLSLGMAATAAITTLQALAAFWFKTATI
jgi:hypothetical protein